MSPKAHFNFLIFCNRMDVKKSPFKLFGTETAENYHFCSILGFFNKYPPVIFQYCPTVRILQADVRKQTLPFVPARYILTFDVISEAICVILKMRRKFEKKCSHFSQHAISEFLKRFQSTKAPLMCFETIF